MTHPSSQDRVPLAQIDPATGYFTNIAALRAAEYPTLQDTTYLDHAGTTPYAKSLVDDFAADLRRNLFGNPHSAGAAAAQLSLRRIDDVRVEVLRFLGAGPDAFEVVFVANATAGIKMVGEALRDGEGEKEGVEMGMGMGGFRYLYHVEAHTSLVGVREMARSGSACLTDVGVEEFLGRGSEEGSKGGELCLLAYPGQSNMTGRKLPLDWCRRVHQLRQHRQRRIYTLFDAAALVSTSPLDLSDAASAPDFTVLSFYKIFGFPDLGALIVRKDAGDVLRRRRFFGGGTVDVVATDGDVWHQKKSGALHSQLEDGTLPFHNILALKSALSVHKRLYGSMHNIWRHTTFLAEKLRRLLGELRHANGTRVCQIYGLLPSDSAQDNCGPVIAFNLRDSSGGYISNSEVEKLSVVKGIQLRAGGLCNPGGVASHLQLSSDALRQHYNAGQRCGDGNDIINGKPTGTIRVSLGATSSMADITSLINFVSEFYVDSRATKSEALPAPKGTLNVRTPTFLVESLSVFPIKSCAAFKIPTEASWKVGPKGLAWDREWCLVHEGTLVALSQKRYPRMALLHPEVDLKERQLRVRHDIHGSGIRQLSVNLDAVSVATRAINTSEAVANRASSVCGESVHIEHYTAPEISQFFTDALGVPCTLARFPKEGTIRQAQVRTLGSVPSLSTIMTGRSISLSNESPILLVSRSSVNRLNEQIKQNGGAGHAVTADSFRGNIIVAESLEGGQSESPYIEDDWTSLRIGNHAGSEFEVLGPCSRCQMVCVDQKSAQRKQEPFSTLAKTRRRNGRVWFGMHLCLTSRSDGVRGSCSKSIRVGDRVTGC